MMMLRWRPGAVAGAAAAALVAAGPPPALLLHPQSAEWAAGSPDAAVGSLAAATAWSVVCWIAAAVLLTTGAQAPGACGRAAARVCAVVTPVVIRRSVEAAIGLTVAAVPVVAPLGAAQADTGRPGSHVGLPSLDRPAGEAPPPVPLPAGASNQPVVRPDVYVVRPGDCLWTIAARHLDQPAAVDAIAATWPRWYATNQAVIGADPDVLSPGQRLVVPKELA